MALSVTSSQNQKTWDATVRVTGGHPLQLWGIGESQAAAEPGLKLDRVVVRDETDRMVGYGQLQIRRENVGRDGKALLVAECLNVHSNRASTIPVLLDALAEHAAAQWDAALFSVELDAPSSPELVAAVREHGWQRTGETPEMEAGPRRLRVNLGHSESDLSSRLSQATLDRCRSGLRVSDVAVREITTRSGDLRAAGLRTEQIGRLLRELGQDSLLLVATQEREGQEPTALGYLWFVHTVGQAMLYRVGFTRAAREMGIDDALLLTGAVELQKRGVQRLDGGDAADPDVPTVVRELADVQRTILGPWRKPLGAETMVAADETSHGAAEEKADKPGKRRRGLFRSARSQKPEQPEAEPQAPASPEPERTVAMYADAAADRAAAERRRDIRRQISSDLGVEVTDQTPAVTTTGAPASEAAGSEAGAAGLAAAGGSADPDRSTGSRSPKAERKQAKARKRQEAEAQSERAGTPDGKQPGSPAATSVAASTGAAAAEPATAMTAARREAEAGPAEDAAAEPATQPSQDARQAHAQPAEAATAAAVEEAPVRPVDVDVQAARREREFKAEQRRAERVAQKAEDLEVQQKPKREPIGKRLRREAGGAIRDAMGR